MPRFAHLSKSVFRKVHMHTWIALGLILTFLPIIFFALYRPSSPEAAWYDDSYAYRKKITFTHNASISGSRRISITVDTAALTTDKMQADCDDTRFTDINGKVLHFQLTADCDTASTDYEVEVEQVINGTNIIYLYYGNPAATNGSQDISGITALSPTGGSPSLGSEEKSEGPVAYWKFDEGYGQEIKDNSSNANNGTLGSTNSTEDSDPNWQNDEMCAEGKCIYLDGNDDLAQVANTASIDEESGLSEGFTYQVWVRPTGEGSSGYVLYKEANTWLKIHTLSNNKFSIQGSLNLTTADATVDVSGVVTNNQWSLVAMSYTNDSDDEITLWVNGEAVGTSNNGDGSPTHE